MKKNILIIAPLFALAFQLHAEEISNTIVEQWDCGQNCMATLYDDGLFKVEPIDNTQEAVMNNYTYKRDLLQTNPDVYSRFYTTAPWRDEEGHFEQIQKIVVAEGVQNVGDCAFYVDSGEREKSHVKEVVLPQRLNKIGYDTFGSNNITSITIPEGVKELAGFAFARSAIETLIIPESVETIGYYAFRNCDNLKSIIIGDNVSSIGLNAFIETPTYVYCKEGDGHGSKSCAELLADSAIDPKKLKIYTIDSNGKIKVGDKTYDSFDDLPKYVLRRIYTLKEAEEASGKTNTVSIRYR